MDANSDTTTVDEFELDAALDAWNEETIANGPDVDWLAIETRELHAEADRLLALAFRESARTEAQEMLDRVDERLHRDARERRFRANFEGDESAMELERSGYFDAKYGEWVPSEVWGADVDDQRRSRGARDLRDEGEVEWTHRDPSDAQIIKRWNVDEETLAYMEWIREEGRENEWYELMVDFRRLRVHRLLQEYFGLEDYRSKQIVLKWEKTPRGNWRPTSQLPVFEWIRLSMADGSIVTTDEVTGEFRLESRGGSALAGLASVERSLKIKLAKKRQGRANA